MRRIGCKLLFCFKGVLQPVEHAVKRFREFIELQVNLSDIDPAVQILALRDFRNILADFKERTQSPYCGDPGEEDTKDHENRDEKKRCAENIMQLHFL